MGRIQVAPDFQCFRIWLAQQELIYEERQQWKPSLPYDAFLDEYVLLLCIIC